MSSTWFSTIIEWLFYPKMSGTTSHGHCTESVVVVVCLRNRIGGPPARSPPHILAFLSLFLDGGCGCSVYRENKTCRIIYELRKSNFSLIEAKSFGLLLVDIKWVFARLIQKCGFANVDWFGSLIHITQRQFRLDYVPTHALHALPTGPSSSRPELGRRVLASSRPSVRPSSFNGNKNGRRRRRWRWWLCMVGCSRTRGWGVISYSNSGSPFF